jgi:hypothetical protein
MGFAKFMASAVGRGLRIVVGLVLIACGLFVMHGTAGTVVAIVGLVPLALGSLNLCLLGPLFGAPFRGADLK